MVQVDIVWSYAFGASFAAASARQLKNEPRPFVNDTYNLVLHFLAIFFAPSGLYLLWQFPQWETMQVASSAADLPAWLVTLFAVTNITQGSLGYYVGYRLARRGRFYAAHANWMVAWSLFWFVLVSGWDTTGWQRFTYDGSMVGGRLWQPGDTQGLDFFLGTVFTTLVIMALFFLPILWLGLIRWNYIGLSQDESLPDRYKTSRPLIGLYVLGTMFGVCLILAIITAVIVKGCHIVTNSLWAAYLVGIPVATALIYVSCFKRGRIMHLIAKRLYGLEPSN